MYILLLCKLKNVQKFKLLSDIEKTFCSLFNNYLFMTKLIRNLINKTHSRIRSEIEQEQYGFFQGTGTRNTVFKIKMLLEEAI